MYHINKKEMCRSFFGAWIEISLKKKQDLHYIS